ncbi:hypothetical protein DX933_12555 [Ornithinibacillus gellani]|uniref:hypothetical protein n=1 Tax=Ornithinibacillus gellani TaxID=2293253 RepID=UPI000F4AC654|nr:hypothetical protein [Ornithinibacillus gellani]TQS74151.1 hypothetical protein DX933_12555 [Ornithinibacillus gellani]
MISRKEKHGQSNTSALKKLIVMVMLVTVLAGGGVTFAFANEDIRTLFVDWLQQKTTASIEDIDEAITKEQEKQTARLKEALQGKMEAVQADLAAFTADEKEKRIQMLQAHAEALLSEMELDIGSAQEEVRTAFDQILQQAIQQMNEVKAPIRSKQKADQDKETNEKTDSPADTPKDEQESQTEVKQGNDKDQESNGTSEEDKETNAETDA